RPSLAPQFSSSQQLRCWPSVATLFAPTRRWLCRRCFAMSIVVQGVRPYVDTRRVSAARPVSADAAAVGLKLVDDVKRLLERAEHVLLEESDVDIKRLLTPVLPFRPDEVGEEVLNEGTLDRRPPPAALGAGQEALGAGNPRVGARLAHLRAARDVQAGGAHLLALEVLQQLRLRECPPLEVHQVLGPAGEGLDDLLLCRHVGEVGLDASDAE